LVPLNTLASLQSNTSSSPVDCSSSITSNQRDLNSNRAHLIGPRERRNCYSLLSVFISPVRLSFLIKTVHTLHLFIYKFIAPPFLLLSPRGLFLADVFTFYLSFHDDLSFWHETRADLEGGFIDRYRFYFKGERRRDGEEHAVQVCSMIIPYFNA
jgi:hypothetical protein